MRICTIFLQVLQKREIYSKIQSSVKEKYIYGTYGRKVYLSYSRALHIYSDYLFFIMSPTAIVFLNCTVLAMGTFPEGN